MSIALVADGRHGRGISLVEAQDQTPLWWRIRPVGLRKQTESIAQLRRTTPDQPMSGIGIKRPSTKSTLCRGCRHWLAWAATQLSIAEPWPQWPQNRTSTIWRSGPPLFSRQNGNTAMHSGSFVHSEGARL